MSRRRHPAPSSTTAAAMSLAQLERWLQDRAERRPVATSLPVMDGYVAAIVAGPVSISPLDWICPLLAVDADAFNHGGTAEFAAISAVVQHHNAISNTLSNNPKQFEPIHQRKPNGDVDARPWCRGFHAAMQPRLSAWAPMLDTRNINHGLLLPILLHEKVRDHRHAFAFMAVFGIVIWLGLGWTNGGFPSTEIMFGFLALLAIEDGKEGRPPLDTTKPVPAVEWPPLRRVASIGQ